MNRTALIVAALLVQHLKQVADEEWAPPLWKTPGFALIAVATLALCIGANSAIYWVDGQPSFTIQFYQGVKIQRLINEIEMAGLREGRGEVSGEVYQEIARNVQKRLREDPPVVLIVSAGAYDLLSRRTDLTVREIFRLEGFHEDAEDELVVFTRATP